MKQSFGILTDVFERITDAFVALDTNWCYTYMNKKAGEIFQRNPKQMIGKHIWTEFPEGIDQSFYKAYYRAMAEQQYIHVEEYYQPYDKWFENHIYPSPDGLSIFFRDITEKKKAEEALKEKNNFIESVINASPDIIYIYDIEEQKNIYVNDGIQINLGYSDDEIKQMGNQVIPILMHPEDFDYYIQNTYPKYETLKNKEIITHEYRMKNKNGNWHWLHSKESIFLRKPDGTPKQIFGITNDITERKKAEEEIARIYKEMDTALNRITDSVISVDSEWRYTFLNDAALTTHPMGKDETMGKLIWDVHPELSESLFGNKFKEAIQTQTAVEFENYYAPYNIWVNIKVYPSKDGLTLYYENITERKKTEQTIKESEEKYRTLVEQASDAIFIADTAGRFITVNTSACKLSQYSEKKLLQMSIHDFAVMEDIQREPFHFDELKQGKTVITERVMKRKDNSVLNVEITAKLLSDGRLLTFVRDITERKKAEQVIKESEERFSTIFKAAPGSMMLFSLPDGKTVEVNDNFSHITGYTREEAIGKNTGEFGMWADPTAREKYLALLEKKGIVTNFEADLNHKSGAILHGLVSGHIITIHEKKYLLGVFFDITERKKAEEEIANTTEQLRQLTAHLQTIREIERKRIAREIHDELGQQLTAIKMDVAWIDKKTADEESSVKNKLKNIITLLDGSNQSVRKILNELRPGVLDDYGLVDALEWQGRQFTETTGIAIEFTSSQTEIKLPQEIVNCIFRVYQESLTNIMRYAQANKVLTSLSIKDESIILTVKDNGKGFDTAALQNKKSFGILGMKERVLSLNGKFELISAKEQGTKIVISLPHKT